MNTKEIITDLLYRFAELQQIILQSRQLLEDVDETNKKEFLMNLLPIMDEFDLLCDELKVYLEINAKEEKEKNEPIDLNLHRFYRDLNEYF